MALVSGNGGGWENPEEHDRKSLCCLEQTVNRNIDVNESASVDSVRSEEHGRGNLY